MKIPRLVKKYLNGSNNNFGLNHAKNFFIQGNVHMQVILELPLQNYGLLFVELSLSVAFSLRTSFHHVERKGLLLSYAAIKKFTIKGKSEVFRKYCWSFLFYVILFSSKNKEIQWLSSIYS